MAPANTGRFVKPLEKSFFNQFKEDSSDVRLKQSIENDLIDNKYGFFRIKDYQEHTGYLINMHSTEIVDEDKRLVAAVDYYFIKDDGSRFRITQPFQPYFYLLAKKEYIQEVVAYISKKFAGSFTSIDTVMKEDLDLPNHLIGLKQRYIKISFATVTEMNKMRQAIMPAVRKNRLALKNNSYYTEMLTESLANLSEVVSSKKQVDHMENIIDIREYDVVYHIRVSTDLKIFTGLWYTVQCRGPYNQATFTQRDDIIDRPDMIVLAFDIETTKLPLKFPDANTDQIMMISYMIDGQGYLINNREIISADVVDFEYTPKPEFEGLFTIFNEPDEAALINRFFEHIMEIRPHIIVTYNGDFFDWPFVETRAAVHDLNMSQEIGFSKNTAGVYSCRPAMHMDCLCWVKRDSYLPVGSQNLKAVAKAKLRYDPVELDPEDMCRLATDEPQVLSNYSVSDAVATYYLYMKYVHPFIFALCTIIPMEPDEVLRKGSGTLCESLLMVEAFHANIIFPNKQEQELNKLSDDGHVLDQETYVGGHVEALESGVFRADIPCRFRLDTSAFDMLIEKASEILRFAIEEEEKVPMESVTNLDEILKDVVEKLEALKADPYPLLKPLIYHLDVGAMYPNIILTNRLQPSAMVNEEICAACDFNIPGAKCQRTMTWQWRGELMPASRTEFQRIQQQLETEKFPGQFPNDPPRAFHQLKRDERATWEKKRLTEYCRKVYKKTHITKIEERSTTICQKENSFYVDTVRAFRDRRYEYKGLCKVAKKQISEAITIGDPVEIKSAKNREILYDSLQLAHKCILNSFYGYVMRKGARWHSMEMAGIVCCTGAAIIKKAREIIERIGRPLELDTDGIWCVLPSTFPENYNVKSTHTKKTKFTVSFPNAVLNSMVKEHFTNHIYHDLVDSKNLIYEQRSENSIFFEVDGPYLAMVLPASKEEGKKLKKRYAVFNLDKSLAELKGFEVKRRGELQIIKIFQSSVFEAFLKGDTLEKCYESVATVADYWLDVLYSKGKNMPDSELFELISENRSMSRKLEDYGAQKSTSISTAKRLAEFLGDQMVKDKGLACRFIISKKPEGTPVTQRAIPLAIFQSELSVKRHYLRRWLSDNSIDDIDIRDVLDWDYYIERLSGTIQKIITIPATLQGLANPVPRVKHPDWLHKKMLMKADPLKQRKITTMFQAMPVHVQENLTEQHALQDIEDFGENKDNSHVEIRPRPMVTKKRKRDPSPIDARNWKEALGPPPPASDIQNWIVYQKKKWNWQLEMRAKIVCKHGKRMRDDQIHVPKGRAGTLGGFLRRAQQTLLSQPWQIIQVCQSGESGVLKLWAMIGDELHNIRMNVPRFFYVNQRQTEIDVSEKHISCTKVNMILPRARPILNLYQYTVLEKDFGETKDHFMCNLSKPGVEGIYETKVTPELRALLNLGCVCSVTLEAAKKMAALPDLGNFSLEQMKQVSHKYLTNSSIKNIFLYCNKAPTGLRAMYALFLTPNKKAFVWVTDTVRTNRMANLNTLYSKDRNAKISRGHNESNIPPSDITFEVRVETEERQVYRQIQRTLQSYRDEKRGPTMLVIQSPIDSQVLLSNIPIMAEFPVVTLHVQDSTASMYAQMEWQRLGCSLIVNQYLNSPENINIMLEQCRYLQIPLGNLPADVTLFASDIFFARHLMKHNFVLWISETDKPDLGGRESDDNRMLMDSEESSSMLVNNEGCYTSYCIELEIDALPVTTLLQSHHIHDFEGTSAGVAFDQIPQASLEEIMDGGTFVTPTYDEIALCSAAFRVLRSMVNVWFRDVVLHKNPFADFQMVHFYRWLRSPNALLYDPALRKTLYSLMRKLFMQLIAEFKRLGSTIIFANFNKIVICTKKKSLEDAIFYVRYVVQNITNKELFHSLQISLGSCWEYLMWLDLWNYSGVKAKFSDKLKEAMGDIIDMSNEDVEHLLKEHKAPGPDIEEVGIEMNWNISEFLPNVCHARKHFEETIAVYMSAIYKHMQSIDSVTLKCISESLSQVTQSNMLGVASCESIAEYAKTVISDELTTRLFSITQKMYKKYPVLDVELQETLSPFLQNKGKHLNPALQFVKTVCKVLSLDFGIEEDIMKLKKNLLRLISVGNFSDEADWTDPCLSWTLPEVICKSCNHCRDIDLCKDSHRSVVNGKKTWLCPNCNSSYDNMLIEHFLIDALGRKVMAYTLQDLQCTKCSEIKMENLNAYCSCAGNYTTVIPRNDMMSYLKTFKAIADYYDMTLLQQILKQYLD